MGYKLQRTYALIRSGMLPEDMQLQYKSKELFNVDIDPAFW